ncbi:hypothetical protein TRAPUB_7240 [Trametes pubescens]|uniref:Uncharacterized protein n=1 Tax=Trametes pubescens TaxID=154538 RepID=A0A1M2V3R4_TRAPU|nr:hypothetical protein TRAPUB_7240 [Trametes pubescens]
MPQPTSSSKPRFTLFSVGRNKASPARVASSKRASLRLSAIRTEALKLPAFDFAESARPDSGDARWEQNGRSRSVPSLLSMTAGTEPSPK